MTDKPKIRSVDSAKDEDGSGYTYTVGGRAFTGYDEIKRPTYAPVTAITMRRDIPGLHGNLDRICVWSNGKLLAEIPRHAADHIAYIHEPESKT